MAKDDEVLVILKSQNGFKSLNSLVLIPQIPNLWQYSVLCKVYTGYCSTSEIEHGLCACTVDNPLAKARGLSLRTGAQTCSYCHLEVLMSLDHF